MKEFFACLAVIIGTIIGAGFASGKEIQNFFNAYEENGLWGTVISSIIFGVVVVLVIFITKKRNVTEYSKLINNNKILSLILPFFSFVCFCIMVSAIGAFASEQLNINFWYGSAFAASICYTMFLNKFKGLEIISCVLVPLIIIGIIVLGISDYQGLSIDTNYLKINEVTNYTGNWLLSAILYASYNSLILVPILLNFRNYNLSKIKIIGLGIGTTLILGILMFLIYRINNIFYPDIMNVELPNMMLAGLLSNEIKYAYGLVMLAAIFTTAFSCGFSFLNMRDKKHYERNAFIMCVISLFCARVGFSNMINICFPIFGYLGIFQIILILITLKNGEGNK